LNAVTRVFIASAFSERRDSEDKIVARRSGWNSRSVMWVVTRLAAAVEPFDDLFDAKCTGRAIAMEIEFEDKLYGFGIDGIDRQDLFDFGAALYDFD
jgi:hypothetical protein